MTIDEVKELVKYNNEEYGWVTKTTSMLSEIGIQQQYDESLKLGESFVVFYSIGKRNDDGTCAFRIEQAAFDASGNPITKEEYKKSVGNL